MKREECELGERERKERVGHEWWVLSYLCVILAGWVGWRAPSAVGASLAFDLSYCFVVRTTITD